MKKIMEIENKLIERVKKDDKSRSGLKGVFVNLDLFGTLNEINFEYNAGGSSSSKLDYQSIINTILNLQMKDYNKKLLLESIEFIIDRTKTLNNKYNNYKYLSESISNISDNILELISKLEPNYKVSRNELFHLVKEFTEAKKFLNFHENKLKEILERKEDEIIYLDEEEEEERHKKEIRKYKEELENLTSMYFSKINFDII